ncbi:MAG: glycosyltransferase family 2 protein [Cyclobacteriaceae bacterium]
MKLSIVVPIYNEAPNIYKLIANLHQELNNQSYEIILVDDGSTDTSVGVVKELAPARTKLLVLNRNYGQTTAMKAGIDIAKGEYIVTMDGDLQNDPSDIPRLLEKIEAENWDIVAGYRLHRHDAFWQRKLPSKIANWLIRSMTGVHLHDYGCSLKRSGNYTCKIRQSYYWSHLLYLRITAIC